VGLQNVSAFLISVLVFIDVGMLIFLIGYLILRKPAPVLQRLSDLDGRGNDRIPEELYEEQPSAAIQRVEQLLRPLSNVAPKSPEEVGRTRRLLIQAGYRREGALALFYGLRVLCAIILPILLYSYFLIVGTMPLVSQIALTLLAGIIGYLLPVFILSFRIRSRQEKVQFALPDALDLMVVCVEAGLGLDQAILRVSEDLAAAYPDMSDELRIVNLEIRAGKPRIDALRNFATRVGVDDVNSLVAMLIQTDRFGTSIAQSLRVHSDSMRVKRRQRAEEKASKVPVKLVFPIFFFIFPAIFIVTLVPAVLQIIKELFPALNGNSVPLFFFWLH
jgi:tight adherence protein C